MTTKYCLEMIPFEVLFKDGKLEIKKEKKKRGKKYEEKHSPSVCHGERAIIYNHTQGCEYQRQNSWGVNLDFV